MSKCMDKINKKVMKYSYLAFAFSKKRSRAAIFKSSEKCGKSFPQSGGLKRHIHAIHE